MSRCSVCGEKFSQEIVDGNVTITEPFVQFDDLTRNLILYRHEGCNQDDYVTKDKAESLAVAKASEPVTIGRTGILLKDVEASKISEVKL